MNWIRTALMPVYSAHWLIAIIIYLFKFLLTRYVRALGPAKATNGCSGLAIVRNFQYEFIQDYYNVRSIHFFIQSCTNKLQCEWILHIVDGRIFFSWAWIILRVPV